MWRVECAQKRVDNGGPPPTDALKSQNGNHKRSQHKTPYRLCCRTTSDDSDGVTRAAAQADSDVLRDSEAFDVVTSDKSTFGVATTGSKAAASEEEVAMASCTTRCFFTRLAPVFPRFVERRRLPIKRIAYTFSLSFVGWWIGWLVPHVARTLLENDDPGIACRNLSCA